MLFTGSLPSCISLVVWSIFWEEATCRVFCLFGWLAGCFYLFFLTNSSSLSGGNKQTFWSFLHGPNCALRNHMFFKSLSYRIGCGKPLPIFKSNCHMIKQAPARLKNTGLKTKYSNFCLSLSLAQCLFFNADWGPNRDPQGSSDWSHKKIMDPLFADINSCIWKWHLWICQPKAEQPLGKRWGKASQDGSLRLQGEMPTAQLAQGTKPWMALPEVTEQENIGSLGLLQQLVAGVFLKWQHSTVGPGTPSAALLKACSVNLWTTMEVWW